MAFMNSTSRGFRLDKTKKEEKKKRKTNTYWITDTTCGRDLYNSVYVLPMSKWRNEVKAAVHSIVHNMSSIQPTLIMEVSLKLIVDVLDDCLKTENREQTQKRHTPP